MGDRDSAGRPDYHDPTAGIGGAPSAISALTLRAWLALFGLVTCAAGAVLLWVVADAKGLAAVVAALAVIAVVDLVVVLRRKLRGEPG